MTTHRTTGHNENADTPRASRRERITIWAIVVFIALCLLSIGYFGSQGDGKPFCTTMVPDFSGQSDCIYIPIT